MVFSDDGSSFLLVISNFVFFIAAARASYTGFPFHAIHFVLVFYVSSIYHACQEYGTCVFGMSLHTHQVADFALAQMAIILSWLLFIPDQHNKWKNVTTWTYIVFFGISILQASTGFISTSLWIGYIIIGISSFVWCVSISVYIYWMTGEYVSYQWFEWVLYILFSGAGLMLFIAQEFDGVARYYNTIHSAWHILVGLGQVFLMHARTDMRPAPIYARISMKIGKYYTTMASLYPVARKHGYLDEHVKQKFGDVLMDNQYYSGSSSAFGIDIS